MSGPGFRSILPPGPTVAVSVDGAPLALPAGRSVLAGLLLADRAGAAADFFCAIGQCQRCLVVRDGRPVLACLACPQGGETIATAAVDGRPPPRT
jgi:aerobic-type carbon monoxide dehydrogenase small subunit (CoxS/CutS family)